MHHFCPVLVLETKLMIIVQIQDDLNDKENATANMKANHKKIEKSWEKSINSLLLATNSQIFPYPRMF